MALDPTTVSTFRYLDVDVDEAAGAVRCRYALDDRVTFEEVVELEDVPRGAWSRAGVDEAVRLLQLLAGISYYKAAAPPVVDLGDVAVRAQDRALLRAFHVDGLGEYAARNDLDLTDLRFTGGSDPGGPSDGLDVDPDAVLVPFGGGVDSIVTLEGLRPRVARPELFVLTRGRTRYAALEAAVATAGLPVRRATQLLDDRILRSDELGYRNGHVPVTGVLSAIALLTAALHGHGAVAMSNEWSASYGNLEHAGRSVNHQWSKSLEFEQLLRDSLAAAWRTPVAYYSWLRARSEVWVARRFAELERYHPVFRSCNRAFAIDPARRVRGWCGECDKCLFIDLVLAPFLSPQQLREVFDGPEPIDRPQQLDPLRTLVGSSGDAKPFECVGDVDECRVAAVLAADRPDRAGQGLLQQVVDELGADADAARSAAPTMLEPFGEDLVPDAHAA